MEIEILYTRLNNKFRPVQQLGVKHVCPLPAVTISSHFDNFRGENVAIGEELKKILQNN